MEIDDIILHTFLCDENFGYLANPSAKDPEHKFIMTENNQPVLVYERDYMHDFLDFLKKAKADGLIEPVVFSQGQEFYAKKLLEIVDPKAQIFEHRFYQNACYLFEHQAEDIKIFVKDVSRFRNRDLRRVVLLDPKPLTFMLCPENGIPVLPFDAEFDSTADLGEKEEYLFNVIEELKELIQLDDVRPHLNEKYQIKRTLKSAKLL
jgi:TFIIF-interacting CTD phosphatase-like protein